MTADQQEELNNLKALLEAGAISQEEFDELAGIVHAKGGESEPSEDPPPAATMVDEEEEAAVRTYTVSPAEPLAEENITGQRQRQEYYQPAEKKSSLPKILAILAGLVIIGGGGYFAYLKWNADSPRDLAVKYCECQKKNDLAYQASLDRINDSLDAGKVREKKPLKALLDELADNYNDENTGINPEIRRCFENFDLEKQKLQNKYPHNEKEGRKFWASFDNEVSLLTDEERTSNLTSTLSKITDKLDKIRAPVATMNPEQATEFIKQFFKEFSKPEFYAEEWFAPEVDRFLFRAGLSPGEVQAQVELERKQFSEPNYQVKSDFAELESQQSDGEQTWTIITLYAFRPTSEDGIQKTMEIKYAFKIYNRKIKSLIEVTRSNEQTFYDDDI